MEKVTIFEPYPFEVGEKIHISGGKRKGDWEVVACDENEVKLRCPVSGKEFTWSGFNCFVEKRTQQWPLPE